MSVGHPRYVTVSGSGRRRVTVRYWERRGYRRRYVLGLSKKNETKPIRIKIGPLRTGNNIFFAAVRAVPERSRSFKRLQCNLLGQFVLVCSNVRCFE